MLCGGCCRRLASIAREGCGSENRPLGCGDSAGESVALTWSTWLQGCCLAARWLGDRSHVPRLWGLRAGSLVIADYLAAGGAGNGVLLWQPVISGRQHLTQFLRLKLANEMLGNVAQRTGMQQLRDRIANGEDIEVAGYRLREDLASGLERSELAFAPEAGRVLWLEVSSNDVPRLSPASEKRIAQFAEREVRVDAAAVTGQPFWRSPRLESPRP
jgi:exosortase A-associated hydrolase 2